MTTIRKINVSQVEGQDADNTNIDDIHKFGETAFYIDSNGNLTLMMFDGIRTHQRSKVLSPGTVYGNNADSGDGNNYDTIKLVPDATLYANGSNQYIVVDPTDGGHIHLRAGGTQDDSTATLLLGGELTHISVSDISESVVILTTNSTGPTTNEWVFGADGNLVFPDSSIQTTAYVPENTVTKVTGTWTVTMGAGFYNFEVPLNGVYQLWVRGNVPNGIVSYTATAVVTNSNVPVVGTQQAWWYSVGGVLEFTSIPDQFEGTVGAISSTNTYSGNTSNLFIFGITNNNSEDAIVEWGYNKIS